MVSLGRILALVSLLSIAADWRQFRGSDSTGVVSGGALPKSFDKDKNIAWTADLPGRGVSGPIVVGDRVFITASSGRIHDRLHVLAFDATSGNQLWQRTFWGTGPTASHPKTCMAAPTPASDGQRVVALFSTNDLVCLDLAGNVLWIRSLYEENPGATDGRGLASSPIIAGNTVIVYCENQNKSFVAGIDLQSGASRWRKDCSKSPNWTTPILLPGDTPAETLVLLQGTTRLSAVEPATGREVWGLDHKSHPIASSALVGPILFVPGMDEGLAAFSPQPAGMLPKLLWENLKLTPDTASPIVLQDKVYVLKGAVLTVGDIKTGEIVSQVRLKGQFSASPVSDGKLLYCFNEEGAAHVIQLGEKEPAAAVSSLGETILCTPAIANGALYVRSDKHLWKIATPKS
jgi:hypothetical protein